MWSTLWANEGVTGVPVRGVGAGAIDGHSAVTLAMVVLVWGSGLALTWRSRTTVLAEPEHVIDTLTDTDACARWSPIPFTVDDSGSDRLLAGTICRVSGRLLGAPIRFSLHTLEQPPRPELGVVPWSHWPTQ